MPEIRTPQGPQHPSFFKQLTRSTISDKFYMRMPSNFCKSHMPRDDHDVILMGESGQEYTATYSAKQNRLMSGGWKDFSIEHKLQEGDNLDFHMIEPCKFKVHIARASRPGENHFESNKLLDAVLMSDLIEEVLMDDLIEENTHNTSQKSQVSCAKSSYQGQKERDTMACQNSKRMRLEGVPTEDRMPVNGARAYITELGGTDGNSNSNIQDSPCDAEHMGVAENGKVLSLKEAHESIGPTLDSESTPLALADQRDVDSNVSLGNKLNFENVKSFEDFKIYVNGASLDAEIPEHSRMKYYELCCSQMKFLHDDLIDNLSSNFVAAMILETIRIADASKSASILVSTIHQLEGMDKTLKSFEFLGMTVGFIRARICEFVKLLNEYQTADQSTSMELSELERERAALDAEKAKIDELRQSVTAREELIGSLESRVDILKEESRRQFDHLFKKAACSAW